MSSPHGHEDYHAQRFAFGDTDAPSQMVAHVPTWIGNPLLTEQACRELASSETDFLREYAAEPQDSIVTRPFPREWIEALEQTEPGTPVGESVIATDPSSGHSDAWVWLVASWTVTDDGKAVLAIHLADGAFGKWARDKGADDVFDQLAADAKRCGATTLFTDQRDMNHVSSGCRRHGLRMRVMRHTTESKTEGVRRLQLFLEAGQIALPRRNRERIKRALKDYQQSETATGKVRFGGRGKRSDDFVAALITLMLADQDGELAQDGKERLWCGEVVERDDDQATLSLWGSGERLVIPLPTVLRAAVVPRHTHAEHREVCERQRRGEPARTLGRAPHFVLVSDDLATQVGDFATARGLTESEAVGQLVSVALRRLGALQRWNEKVRSRRAGSETRTDRQGTP